MSELMKSPSLVGLTPGGDFVMRIKLPPTSPLAFKVCCLPPTTLVSEAILTLSSIWPPLQDGNYAFVLPSNTLHSKKAVWLDDNKTIGFYPQILENEFIEVKKRPFALGRGRKGSLIAPSKLIKEGGVLKMVFTTKLWSPRYLRLYDSKLCSGNSEFDNNPEIISLLDVVSVDPEPDKKYAFFLNTTNDKFVYRCRNNQEMLDWVAILKENVKTVPQLNDSSIIIVNNEPSKTNDNSPVTTPESSPQSNNTPTSNTSSPSPSSSSKSFLRWITLDKKSRASFSDKDKHPNSNLNNSNSHNLTYNITVTPPSSPISGVLFNSSASLPSEPLPQTPTRLRTTSLIGTPTTPQINTPTNSNTTDTPSTPLNNSLGSSEGLVKKSNSDNSFKTSERVEEKYSKLKNKYRSLKKTSKAREKEDKQKIEHLEKQIEFLKLQKSELENDINIFREKEREREQEKNNSTRKLSVHANSRLDEEFLDDIQNVASRLKIALLNFKDQMEDDSIEPNNETNRKLEKRENEPELDENAIIEKVLNEKEGEEDSLVNEDELDENEIMDKVLNESET